MKSAANILLPAVMMLLLASCEKVISPNLNTVAKKYVIEGNISNEPGGCQVKITQTKNFAENNDFAGVSGAIVTVSDNGGAPITLSESSQGTYSANSVSGTPGHTYTLTAKLNGETFTSSSTMPVQVSLDTLYVEDKVLFGDTRKVAAMKYKDPAGKGNAYHFIQYKNNVRESTVFVTNDDYTDGNTVTTELLYFDNNDDDDTKKIKTGDTIKVIMECIDTPVYTYWFSIDGATGASNNATPANPVSNITGGALGYFSAHTVQAKSVSVK